MVEIHCQCGNTIREEEYPSLTSAYYLTESNEDRYADSIAMPVEACVESAKSDGLEKWFSKNRGSGYPDDLSEGTFVYDIIGNSQSANMDRVFECDKCGAIHFLKAGEVLSYFSSSGYNRLFACDDT